MLFRYHCPYENSCTPLSCDFLPSDVCHFIIVIVSQQIHKVCRSLGHPLLVNPGTFIHFRDGNITRQRRKLKIPKLLKFARKCPKRMFSNIHGQILEGHHSIWTVKTARQWPPLVRQIILLFTCYYCYINLQQSTV